MSVQQLEALIKFLEGQPELAHGRCSRSKEGRSVAKGLWLECTKILNSVSSDCVQKTVEQWRMFYNEFKHRMLKKIKKEKIENEARGFSNGGLPSLIQLTPLQKRLYTILGRDEGEPVPRFFPHNPITHIENESSNEPRYDQKIEHEENEGGSSSSLNNNGVNVVDDQGEPGNFQMEFNINLTLQPEATGSQCSTELTGQRQQSEFTASQALRESLEPRVQECKPAGFQNARASQATGTSSSTSRKPAPRRRREETTESEDPSNSMRRATSRLEAMKRLSAQATREHAQATNRLAAAIETLAHRLRDPIKIVLENPPEMVHRRRKRARHYDSDSE